MNVCMWWQGPGRGEEDMHRALRGKLNMVLEGWNLGCAALRTENKQRNKTRTKQKRHNQETLHRLSSSQGKNKLLVLCAKLLQSCPTLCNPTDCSSPGSSVLGILQAGIFQCVAMPSCRGSSQPREPVSLLSPALVGRFFTTRATFISLQAKGQECLLVFPFLSFL